MKAVRIIAVCLIGLAVGAMAQEKEPFDYPQSWSEEKSSAPKDLELIENSRNPYFNMTDNMWYFRVKAVDADGKEVGIKDKRTGRWVAAGNPIKLSATVGQINTLFDQQTGANMAVKLKKALLKYAVLVLKP